MSNDRDLLWQVHFWLTDAPGAKSEVEVREALIRRLSEGVAPHEAAAPGAEELPSADDLIAESGR